jgi:hypothetical protein
MVPKLRSMAASGKRLPVSLAKALTTGGEITGTGGSPQPEGLSVLGTPYTSHRSGSVLYIRRRVGIEVSLLQAAILQGDGSFRSERLRLVGVKSLKRLVAGACNHPNVPSIHFRFNIQPNHIRPHEMGPNGSKK